MNRDDLVSVIVPVYNTSDYLNICINSILNQSYKKLEIILVDDGSTDQSAEICDQYTFVDDRVKVIHQKNSGVSNARNKGLEQSNGEFIAFVDSDDTIDERFIEILYSGFNEAIDMTVCSFDIIESTNGRLDIHDGDKTTMFSREESIKTVLLGKPFSGHVCNKMFRKRILGTLKFQDGIYVSEDTIFTLEYLLSCNNTLYIEKPLYKYYIRNTSASHGTMSDKKMTAFDALDIIENKIETEYGKQFLQLINYNGIKWVICFYNILTYDKSNRKRYNSLLKEKLKKYKRKAPLSNRMKMKIFLLSINANVYYFAVRSSDYIRKSFKKNNVIVQSGN